MNRIDWVGLFWGCVVCVLFIGTIQILFGNGPEADNNEIILSAACKCPVARLDQTDQDISELMAWQSGHGATRSTSSSPRRTGGGQTDFLDHRTV